MAQAAKSKGKFLICSDSLSTLEAVKNVYNEIAIISKIRDMCIQNNQKIKLMWVPGHKGIKGNEVADMEARYAISAPTHQFHMYSRDDLRRFMNRENKTAKQQRWASFHHDYARINTHLEHKFPKEAKRQQIKMLVRLRIGHTKMTHENLLIGHPRNSCQHCNSIISVRHILDECIKFKTPRMRAFGENSPTELLKSTSLDNIQKFEKYLKEIDMLDKIKGARNGKYSE